MEKYEEWINIAQVRRLDTYTYDKEIDTSTRRAVV
jgi:hypothetical protein